MDWLVELFTEPTYIQATVILAIICAAGIPLGQIKVKGISLGVTFVFFAGIVAGHFLKRFGVDVNWSMVNFAQNFGLIIFVYSLGLQVGPGFFASLKKGGIKLNLLGIGTIVVTSLAMVLVYALGGISFSDAVGVLSGAVTNTPMLGAAQQALLDVHPEQVDIANGMATACAVGYPVGVLGVLLSTIILKATVSRKEEPKVHDEAGDTYVAEFHVSNPAIFEKSIKHITTLTDKHMIISRIWREGKVTIPMSTTVLHRDDHLLVVLNKEDIDTFNVIFGEKDKTDWNRPDIDWDHIDGSNLMSKHLYVTRSELNGVKIGSLNLRKTLGINITRINRAGVQLVAYNALRLQVGDRLTVVGTEDAINRAGEILGNQQKVLSNPNLTSLFIGVAVGVILGMIPIFLPGMSVPVKLGIAGGPLVIGILMGAFGPRLHLSTYTTRSANLMLRQMGLTIYLACLGLSAGGSFFETVLSMQGLRWVLDSFIIALLPCIVIGVIASKAFKVDYAHNVGMICASMANPMALSYANTVSDETEAEASEAYATVYPLSMFVRVLSGQLLMLIFLG